MSVRTWLWKGLTSRGKSADVEMNADVEPSNPSAEEEAACEDRLASAAIDRWRPDVETADEPRTGRWSRTAIAAIAGIGVMTGGTALALIGTLGGSESAEVPAVAAGNADGAKAAATPDPVQLAQREPAERDAVAAEKVQASVENAAAVGRDRSLAATPETGREARPASPTEVAMAEAAEPTENEGRDDVLTTGSITPSAEEDASRLTPAARIAMAGSGAWVETPSADSLLANAASSLSRWRTVAEEARPGIENEPARAGSESTALDEAKDMVNGLPMPEPRPTSETAVAAAESSAVGLDATDAEAASADQPEDVAEQTTTSRVNTFVNMRAGPENSAEVLTVLDKGQAVEVIQCDLWCEVRSDGKRGWVYKSFVESAG